MKDVQIGKEERKPFLVTDDMIVHVENPKACTEKKKSSLN